MILVLLIAAILIRLYREQRRNGLFSRDFDKKLASSNGLARFVVKELTQDHHPNRDDERIRVEAAGGYVIEWGGVPRVNGQLAISRAIGDVSYKRLFSKPFENMYAWYFTLSFLC